MSIKYCDYINGNDSTGDGSAGNPYKTITQASTGLAGGDEVRGEYWFRASLYQHVSYEWSEVLA